MAEVTDKTRATISITSKGQTIGDIVLKFFQDVAPGHAKNFVDLAKKGFYNGTTFHRVIPKFMIQGGDPNSKNADRASHGMGGPGYKIKAEFNSKPHKRGVVSMARANDPDSAVQGRFPVFLLGGRLPFPGLAIDRRRRSGGRHGGRR